MTAQQTPRAAISPALKQRASETRSAFANQDAAASKQAHDETIRDWEEDGHGEGDAAMQRALVEDQTRQMMAYSEFLNHCHRFVLSRLS